MTGSLVAAKLLDRGDLVIGFDNFFSGSRDLIARLQSRKGFHFIECDIACERDLDEVFMFAHSLAPACNAGRSFLNCAAVVHTRHFYHPDDTFATNVLGMRETLERAINSGFDIYINCSTSEVYSMRSWQDGGGVRESDPVLMATAEQSLRTSYATGKLMTEFFMRDAVERGRIKGCSIRFANVYSPDEVQAEHVIPYIIDSLRCRQEVVLLENARVTYRTFLHNSDSCSSILALVDAPAALDGSVYNVGTTEEIAIVDLVHKISDLMGLGNISITYHGSRSADPARRLLNIDKIRKATGWVPKVSLTEGLRQCIDARTTGIGQP